MSLGRLNVYGIIIILSLQGKKYFLIYNIAVIFDHNCLLHAVKYTHHVERWPSNLSKVSIYLMVDILFFIQR